jgi:hypothetical protein
MTFWIATINPYKYAKSQLPHELTTFKTPCPNQQKAVLASFVLRVKRTLSVFDSAVGLNVFEVVFWALRSVLWLV